MKQRTQYTSMDTIFSKFHRDLRGTDITESDLVEWAAEALGFMNIVEIQEEAVAFIEVENHTAELPCGFQAVIQVARNNDWNPYDKESTGTCTNDLLELEPEENTIDPLEYNPLSPNVFVDCLGQIIGDHEPVYYRPYFDLKYEYELWTSSTYYRKKYSPVRLANHSFFNSLVAKESDKDLYNNITDEYTIAGGYPNMNLRLSFMEGQIALAYMRAVRDANTGYPVIPDQSEFISAITYYIKWKMAERLRWSGREGFHLEAQDAERNWTKYMRMGINKMKMPQGVDQYQNIMEQSLYLLPRHRKYYGYFGKLGREEDRKYNNPDRRRRNTFNRYGRF